MATSGTVGQTTFKTRKLFEHAFRRCKIKPTQVTAEMLETAKDCAWLMLSALPNRSTQLWAIDRTILPLYENQRLLPLPVGSLDFLTLPTWRTLHRLTASATVASSAGGTASLAFDDDFDTACTQTSINGNISAVWENQTLVTTVGLLPNASGTWSYTFQRSDDGITWTTIEAESLVTIVAGEWQWYDLDGSVAAYQFRVLATGGTTLDLRELFLGNSPREIPISRLNIDDYEGLPDKTSQGNPLQFYLDRQRTQPLVNLWKVPARANRYDQLIGRIKRQVQDVGTLSEEIEVPQRWYDAMVSDLAWRLAMEIAEVPDKVDPTKLRAMAELDLKLAIAEERDNSPSYWTPDIAMYTRS